MSKEGMPSAGSERHEAPELLELINLVETIERIINWLMESGPGGDPMTRAMQRARLHSLYVQLGIDPDDPNAMRSFLGFRREISDRIKHPQPQMDLPEIAFFEERITQLRTSISSVEQGPRISIQSAVDLADIALFGYTDWNKIQSRISSRTDGEYIHDVATIMADPIAYHGTFLSSDIASYDVPAIDTYWRVQNGRHRSLATKCLGPDFVRESGMHNWVKVSVEPQ